MIDKEAFKKSLKNFMKLTTVHGVQNFYRANNFFIRLMWLFSLFVSASFCVYFIVKSVSDYLNYEIVSQINVNYEARVKFPTISFCSDSYFKVPDSLVNCLTNKENCLNKTNYFTSYNDSFYKTCYRFNSKNSLYSTQPGLEFGLRLGLNFNMSKSESKSLIIYIHNHSVSPLIIYNKGTEISTGKYIK